MGASTAGNEGYKELNYVSLSGNFESTKTSRPRLQGKKYCVEPSFQNASQGKRQK